MNKFVKYILIFLLPFIAGIIYLFSVPLNEAFSYRFVKEECGDKASWIYYRIFEDKRDIDVAFSGASQIGSALMDELIETKLSRMTGEKIRAANLGYCRRGRDIQYSMLHDLFQQKNPEILIVEVYEDEPKKSQPVFPYIASTSELFNSFVFFNQRFLSAVWKGITVRFEYLKARIFNAKLRPLKNLPEFGYRDSKHVVSDEALIQNEKNWINRLKHPKAKWRRKIELNYSKHYLEKIIKLAHKNNCDMVFLYLPESGSHLERPLLNEYYSKMAKIIYLPDEIINDKQNWKDATHFNDRGAEKASKLVVKKLNEMFYGCQ